MIQIRDFRYCRWFYDHDFRSFISWSSFVIRVFVKFDQTWLASDGFVHFGLILVQLVRFSQTWSFSVILCLIIFVSPCFCLCCSVGSVQSVLIVFGWLEVHFLLILLSLSEGVQPEECLPISKRRAVSRFSPKYDLQTSKRLEDFSVVHKNIDMNAL